jgi:hypothetical protein
MGGNRFKEKERDAKERKDSAPSYNPHFQFFSTHSTIIEVSDDPGINTCVSL